MKNFFKKIIIPIITWQAMHLLGRKNPKIIAVTGSVGKTSTKDAIYTFISHKFKTRKSDKSFNSEIGVPLTILGLPTAWSNPIGWIWNLIKGFYIAFFCSDYPEVLVLEMGADKPGDIEGVVGWVSPDIAVLTALADVPVHVENFNSDPELVYKEKGKLLEALTKDGIAILNADDARVMGMRGLTEAKVLTFGVHNQADTTSADIIMPRVSNPYAVLSGAAVAEALGMSGEEIKKLSAEVRTPPGRMSELKGINNSLIIDDTYNSSPVALASALNTLKNLETQGKKIAVLGDMMELGKFSEEEHRKVGAMLIDIVDSLVVVGSRARWIFEEAKEKRTDLSKLIDFKVCESSVDAGEYLKHIIKDGDIILIKGSQSARMEKAIEQILNDPINDRKLLVRQDEEWKNK